MIVKGSVPVTLPFCHYPGPAEIGAGMGITGSKRDWGMEDRQLDNLLNVGVHHHIEQGRSPRSELLQCFFDRRFYVLRAFQPRAVTTEDF